MQLEKFSGPGSLESRRKLWNSVVDVVLASQKRQGKNITVDEREGYGSVINAIRDRPGGGECTCPRDVTEIGGWHINALVAGGDCYTGAKLMSRTWLRINHDEDFSEPRQFKLWIDEPCDENGGTINYEDNSDVHPIVESDTAGVVSIRMVFTTLEFTSGASPFVTIGYYVEAYLEATPDDPPFCRSTFADTNVDITTCDFTPMIDSYNANTQLCDCDGTPNEGCTECWSAGGSLNFFGPV